jgi:hypothetical protein
VQKRILFGLVKGTVLGLAVGCLFHFGLGWRVAPDLLGYLIAMGTGATAGILAGRPPWLHEAWLESLLKGVFGLAVGAALYWAAVRFIPSPVSFSVFGSPENTEWTSLPMLVAPPIAVLFALVVELDNNGASIKPGGSKPAAPKPKPAASAGASPP